MFIVDPSSLIHHHACIQGLGWQAAEESDGVPVWTETGQSTSFKVQALHAWWMAHRGAADVPDRSALWPGDIAKLLPFLFISEVEPAPFRIRYRLVGTKGRFQHIAPGACFLEPEKIASGAARLTFGLSKCRKAVHCPPSFSC
jgi:hypothetical protein